MAVRLGVSLDSVWVRDLQFDQVTIHSCASVGRRKKIDAVENVLSQTLDLCRDGKPRSTVCSAMDVASPDVGYLHSDKLFTAVPLPLLIQRRVLKLTREGEPVACGAALG